MNTNETFYSELAAPMADFVSFKRMQGYDFTGQVKLLRIFDRFLLTQECTGDLLPEHISTYLLTTTGLSAPVREGRLSVVREFSRYLNVHRAESTVVPLGILPRSCPNIRFYPIEREQVGNLMTAAARLHPAGSIRGAGIRFLIGLMYATGLRISEALNLNLGDVDTEEATLFVHNGKFGKDRLVALSPSTADALNGWLEIRSHHAATGPSAPLLVSRTNRRLTYRQAKHAFAVLCRQCGLKGSPSPRLHDLRHNFACHCIRRWREDHQDIHVLLPVLANAMGHVNYFTTQKYIHINAADLQQASASFRNHAKQQRED